MPDLAPSPAVPGAAPAKLLLDVDGVINADRPGWPDADARATVTLDCCVDVPLPLRWSPMLLAKLANLHHLGLVEIRWCTSWCPHVDTLHQVWNLPTLQACWSAHIPAGPQVDALKLKAARDVLADGARLIWVDDEAIPRANVRRSLAMTGDALYIVPDPRRGLSPGQVRQITEFALAPAARPAATGRR